MRDILLKLLAPVAPSGQEGAAADAVCALIKGHIDSLDKDIMGNVIAVKRGKPEGKHIMLSSHMDHIGYIVTDIEKEGFLRVMTLGGIGLTDTARPIVFVNGVEGVLCAEPRKKGETLDNKHLFADIGAQSREEALQRVQIGDCAVVKSGVIALGEHRIAAPAMDDRCACALQAAALLQMEAPLHTVTAVFSVQEEVGCRGAKTAAFDIAPDIGLALDVTAWGDTPEVKLPSVRLGAGAAIKFMDRGSIANPYVRDALIACAEKVNAPYQREVLPYGGTDALAMQMARGAIATGTLSIPCRYVHSACEVIDMRDMESALAILLQFVNHPF